MTNKFTITNVGKAGADGGSEGLLRVDRYDGGEYVSCNIFNVGLEASFDPAVGDPPRATHFLPPAYHARTEGERAYWGYCGQRQFCSILLFPAWPHPTFKAWPPDPAPPPRNNKNPFGDDLI